MNKPVVQLGPDAVKQIAKWVRENARRIVNERPVRQRWQNVQPSQSCTRRYLVTVYYFPIGGSFVIQVRARDPATDDIVSQNKTISYNASASDVATAIETHPHIDTGTVAVMGSGNFPNHSMTITLPGDAELSYVSNTFTRQSTNDPYPNVLITECCT